MSRKKHRSTRAARKGPIMSAEMSAKIFEALNDRRYVARTIKGIATSTHLREPQVVEVLRNDQNLRGAVKIYPRKSKNGKLLITTKEKFEKTATTLDRFIDYFATKKESFDDFS
ncbi:hypothetical protein [Methylomarinum vadi]|uniref:hypothetical protein n=1 Tax=Methylomarinum vadi TaxID=438855 RepID=UPI0004DF69D4|nr:hypothetical protein [Methylomarinum vadi]